MKRVFVPKCFVVDFNFNFFHDEQSVDYAMIFLFLIFNDGCHESKFADHPVEEQVVVPIVLMDDIAGVHDFPKYDEYVDDYKVDFLEKPTVFS